MKPYVKSILAAAGIGILCSKIYEFGVEEGYQNGQIAAYDEMNGVLAETISDFKKIFGKED